MRIALKVIFWLMVCLLALSFVFTIAGSATNHDGILVAGVIGWLASSFLLFAWLVLLMLARAKRYEL
jgi:hypothetical protein